MELIKKWKFKKLTRGRASGRDLASARLLRGKGHHRTDGKATKTIKF